MVFSYGSWCVGVGWRGGERFGKEDEKLISKGLDCG